MLSTAIAAWRNLVKRLTVDWLILAAGAVTVLLAMVLLAAGPIYADAVTQSSLRRALVEAPHAESTVVVDVRTPPDQIGTVDDIASRALDTALAGVESTIIRVSDAEALQLGDAGPDDEVALAQVRSMEAIDEHATLVEGVWPGTGLETVVSAATAELLELGVGDQLTLTDRRDRSRQVQLDLVGVFQPDDSTDRYWLEEELLLGGVSETPGFLTYGPFVVAPQALPEITPRVIAEWRAYVDFDSLEVGDAARLRARVAGLSRTLNDALATIEGASSRYSQFGLETGLDSLLAGTARSLTVTRSSVLALLIQLAILAGYALTLTAGLLVETRSTETYLLQARGVSPLQMVGVAALEGALITLPIALLAPSVAAWTLETIATVGPLSTVVLDVAPTVTTESRLIALIAAALAVIGLAWPAWRSARSATGTTRRARQRSRSGAQRAGVDIALLGLAALAFWQLQSLGSEVSATVQGRFGVDPVLIAAPTLGLLAGAVLALRIVPLLARMGERVAGSGRGSVTALSAWQVARRPLRYARSALLLIMAVAIGFFATSYSSTWLQSQRDQADFQVGADLRVAPNRRTGDSITDLHLLSAHRATPGVTDSMPVSRVTGPVPGANTTGEFVLLDSAKASNVVQVRPDLAPEFGSLMAHLEAGRFTLPGIPLPGEPERIGVTLEVVEEEILASEVIPDFGGAEDEVLLPEFGGEVSVVVKDADDLLHRLELGQLTVNLGPQTLETSLVSGPDGARLIPAFPLEVVAVEISSGYPSFAERSVTLDLMHLVVTSSEGSSETITFDPETWNGTVDTLGQAFRPARITSSEHPEEGLRVIIDTGLSFQALAAYSFRLPTLAPSTYPVAVASSWLEASSRQVGDILAFETLRTGRSNAVIVGAFEAFPSTQPRAREVVIADLPTYQSVRYSPGALIADVGEHWLAVDGDPDQVSATLRAAPMDAREVEGRAERFLALSTDPVALGTIGALSIGFVAAAVFAAVGFAVSATVSARERITEFGLLRALGLSPRQLGSWMTLEQSLLVLSSLGFGTLVGWALTTVILPLVTVTQQGTTPIPGVTRIYPWDAVAVLEVSLVVVLALIVVVMSVLLRRLGLGSLLRVGEE